MNYYELLGVPETATTEEIKHAYKIQIKKWHPDINKSEEAINISIKLNEAKEILLDETKRAEYDRFLKEQQEETYNKYVYNKNNKQEESDNNKYEQNYEQEMVTKWQYLYSWIKYAKVKKYRKVLGVIGVLLESLLCFIIKLLLIALAFICNLGSIIILLICNIIAPFIGLAMLILIIEIFMEGLSKTISDNSGVFMAIVAYYVIYVVSYMLPDISDLILSPRIFDILYNKIDINLFKKCVGYKD